MRRRVRAVLLVVSVAVLLAAAGCSSAVTGRGIVAARPSGPSTGPSTNPAAEPTACPAVRYPAAKISFRCPSGRLVESGDDVWPLAYAQTVEQNNGNSQWQLEEGAGRYGSTDGASASQVAKGVRDQMLHVGAYGERPSVTTVANRAQTVDGHRGWLQQTTIKLDPTWAKQDGTKVREEHLWIVVVPVGSDDVSLWFITVPDLAKQYWPAVPGLIASIRVQ